MKPTVSIILPTYNGQRFIGESIVSCLNQTYSNIELIIVNDASTDTTPEIIAYYAKLDSRIKVIHNRVNKKLPTSLNIGHAICRGDFITWTSDDNIYLPNALERMVNFLDENQEVGLVYADYSAIDERGEVLDNCSVQAPSFLWRWSVVKCCFLYRREVYRSVGKYSDKMRLVEDHDYWLRVHRKYKIMPLHENLYQYRIHSNSLSSQYRPEVKKLKEILFFRYSSDFDLPGETAIVFYKKYIRLALRRHEFLSFLGRLMQFSMKYPKATIAWLTKAIKI